MTPDHQAYAEGRTDEPDPLAPARAIAVVALAYAGVLATYGALHVFGHVVVALAQT